MLLGQLPQLRDDHPTVRSLVGTDWLERKVAAAGLAAQRQRGLSPSDQGATFARLANPLVGELHGASTGRGAARGETPYLDMLEFNLRALGSSVPLHTQRRLRLDEDASKLMYELMVAAGFASSGHLLTWLPDRGSKRPEMLVGPEATPVLSVECKKRDAEDGYEKEASRFWAHFQHELLPAMGERHLNYAVRVSGPNFRMGDYRRCVQEALAAMEGSSSGRAELLSGRYQIEFARLAEEGGSIPSEVIDLFPRGVYGINAGEVPPDRLSLPRIPGDRFAEGAVLNPRVVRLALNDDPDRRVKGVLRNLKAAAQQVTRDLPGLAYIDVNLEDPDREEAEFEGIVAAVNAALRGAYTRLSGVVLTSIRPATTVDDQLCWWAHTEFITQERAVNPIPVGFRFPGDNGAHQWFPGNWARMA